MGVHRYEMKSLGCAAPRPVLIALFIAACIHPVVIGGFSDSTRGAVILSENTPPNTPPRKTVRGVNQLWHALRDHSSERGFSVILREHGEGTLPVAEKEVASAREMKEDHRALGSFNDILQEQADSTPDENSQLESPDTTNIAPPSISPPSVLTTRAPPPITKPAHETAAAARNETAETTATSLQTATTSHETAAATHETKTSTNHEAAAARHETAETTATSLQTATTSHETAAARHETKTSTNHEAAAARHETAETTAT